MTRSISLLTAAVVSLAGLGAASAADMAVKARPMPVAVYNWTGCYIGVSAGAKGAYPSERAVIPGATGGTLTTTTTVQDFGRDSNDDSTWLAGGQVGCNYQAAGSHWVFGVEGDAHAQHWSQTNIVQFFNNTFVPGDRFDLASDWQASARGRIGYAFDRTLFYVTGGAAFTDVRATTNWIPFGIFPGTTATQTRTLVGGTVGAGVEYAVTNNITLGMEGRYTQYESQRFDAGPLAVIGLPGNAPIFVRSNTYRDVRLETGEILFKANYKFGPGVVVAKY
jgi:outer membrane immunogenic protein